MSSPKEWAWQDDEERFTLFEQVRKAREKNGSIHDCKQSTCATDPNGVNIKLVNGQSNPVANPSKRPPLDASTLANIQKLRDRGYQA